MYYDKKISASMRECKRLQCELDIEKVDTDIGVFAGYASVFGVVDNQRDVMERGAFTASLAARTAEIKLLWQHNAAEPIGVFTQMFEDENGLYVEGKLLLDIARAREAQALLKAGAIKGLSIGYSPVRYHIDPDTGIRYLKEVELWEVSLVTFPANDKAGVTVVKGLPTLSSSGRAACPPKPWRRRKHGAGDPASGEMDSRLRGNDIGVKASPQLIELADALDAALEGLYN